jgi:aspartyl-tRNA(Asn)/glutamyl-tRNA(Gln) amidotransferase subunit A
VSDPVDFWSARQLLHAYRTKTLSPLEATRSVLSRIEALNGALNAYCHLDAEGALEAARASEARWSRNEPRGLLDGVPVSIKDVLLTRGMPTLHGSRTVSPHQPWTDDAPAVARLREHGAIILGKTTTPELGHKFVTDSPLTGITRNPWNLERSPGGSSGGAAAAVAAGLGPLAVGTDGGGSIRIPATWSGIVGHKPTAGRVPTWPPSRWGALSHVGPLARSVEDAALLLTVLAGPDRRDPAALPPDGRDYRIGLEDGVAGLRIAYSPDLGLAAVEPEIAAAVEAAARALERLGARVAEIKHPGIEAIVPAHRTCYMAIFAQFLEGVTPAQRDLLDPYLRAGAEAGRAITAAAYHAALMTRQAVAARMEALFTDHDLLVLPGFHVPPPPVPGLPEGLRGKAPALTCWANHTGQPVASVPCGLTRDGLPIGMQIAGPRFADALVLRAARAFEVARGPFPRPPLETARPPIEQEERA